MKITDYSNVSITDGFWKKKQLMNKNVTMESVWNRFVDTGRIGAFKFDWIDGSDKKPHIFWDSDVAKWIEAASYIIRKTADNTLQSKVEKIIDLIEKNQDENGYFNTYFTVCEPENRFKERGNHELYCAGHLIEAAVAYVQATGRDRFLNCMVKYADYIYKVFVTDKSAAFITPGHEEIELALIRLYCYTKCEKHLRLAEFFINNRGKQQEQPVSDYTLPEYSQSHIPVREQKTAVGHAVRACYLYVAMAELAGLTGDAELYDSCKSIFEDIISKKMYITGGIGSTHIGEAFTLPYDLPNETAYNETCASIGMMLFAKSMMKIDNNSVYADIIEKEMYNGMISGVSVDGKAFFYENPLELTLKNHKRNTSTKTMERYPITHRKEIFECSCCPPNINRTLASIQEYIYGFEGDTCYINQFIDSELITDKYRVKQKTNYPVDGRIFVECKGVNVLMIRIPGWCDKYRIDCKYQKCGGYIKIENPESIEIEFEMKPFLVYASSDVADNAGKAAVQMGPVVYCAEGLDNCENLHSLSVYEKSGFKVKYDEQFGLNTIEIEGCRTLPSEHLYENKKGVSEDVVIKLIPYCCFANRDETDMLVWLNVK